MSNFDDIPEEERVAFAARYASGVSAINGNHEPLYQRIDRHERDLTNLNRLAREAGQRRDRNFKIGLWLAGILVAALSGMALKLWAGGEFQGRVETEIHEVLRRLDVVEKR